jgi:chorismate mutase
MKVADEIGVVKKQCCCGKTPMERILGKMIWMGNKGLSEEFVLKLFKAIHQESISHQDKVLNA